MKRELWPKVRVGSFVIYADEYEGVFRAKVTEVDVRIYSERAAERWSYPYGLTEETGVVRILYDGQEKVENLKDLIPYSPWRLGRLRRDWSEYQSAKATSDAYRSTYLARITEYREL